MNWQPRTVASVVAGAVTAAACAAFVILYLSVPPGWSPPIGFAPRIGAVFRGYPTWTLSAATFQHLALAVLAGAWLGYAAFVLLARDPAVVAVLAVAARLLLVLVPPALSSDLYHYALFGRMVAAHGWNPYVTTGNALAGDPLWPLASWQHLSSHYGPTFTWISAALAGLGHGDPLATALWFKGAAALADLGSCWLVWRLAAGDRLQALALYALNPLILIELAGNGHCDAFMIALALAGLRVGQPRPAAGLVLLLLSFTTKYLSGVLVLLFAIQVVARAPDRHRAAARLAAVAAAVLVALYAPFWRGLAGFGTTLDLVLRARTDPHVTAPLRILPLALFTLATVLAAMAAARLPRITELAAALVLLFLLVAFAWRLPWYFTTPLALANLGPTTTPNRALRLIALWLGAVFMLLYCALLPVGRG
jgi:hypothetical protein